MKKVSIAFLGNAFKDTRVMNLSHSLEAEGCIVEVISFDWQNKNFKFINPNIKVVKLKKRKFSLPFYFSFAFHIIKQYSFKKYDYYIAEDVYTLPFAAFFSKVYGGKLYYNSRELYPHLAGLRNKGRIQKLIAAIEKRYITKCDFVMTTGSMDAEFLRDYYRVQNIYVLRNLPIYKKPNHIVDLRKRLNIDAGYAIIIYQGVVLEGRGISVMIKALKEIPKSVFVVLGEGVFKETFMQEAEEIGVSDRVLFYGSVNQDELINYTAGADLGIALIENISKSYYYALPNKLFEYIMAEIPSLVSKLPQMEKIVNDYQVGEVIDISEASNIIKSVARLTGDKELLKQYTENCKKAAGELNWQNEFDKVKKDLFPDLI